MADTLTFPFSGRVILDSNGDPVAGAKLEVFDAGTTTQRTVYTDAALTTPAANPVVADATGIIPLRFLGKGDWKVTFRDSSDVTLSNYDTWDDVPGAIDTSAFLTGTVAPSRASESETANATMTSAQRGKQINGDATGGNFTYTLEAATAGGDSTDIVVKNTGETGYITVDRSGDDLILAPGDSATFRSDGATWQVVEAFNMTDGVVTITYSSTINPDLIQPTGTGYVVDTVGGDMTVGTPGSLRPGNRGYFKFVQDGSGGREITFSSSYSGDVYIDEAANAVSLIGFVVNSTSQVEIFDMNGPREPVLSAIIRRTSSKGSSGQGAFTSNTWTKVTYSNIIKNDGRSIESFSSSVVRLKPGKYRFEVYFQVQNASGDAIARIRNTSDGSTPTGAVDNVSGDNTTSDSATAYIFADDVEITAAKNFETQFWSVGASAGIGLDQDSDSGEDNHFGRWMIWRYPD